MTISNGEKAKIIRTKLNRLLDRTHDIRAYGADVNETETSNRIAFQAAFDAAGHEPVLIPPGRFVLDQEVTINGDVPLVLGSGYASQVEFTTGGFRRVDQGSAGGWQLGGFRDMRIKCLDGVSWCINWQDSVIGLNLMNVLAEGEFGILIDQNTNDGALFNVSCRAVSAPNKTSVGLRTLMPVSIVRYNAHGHGIGIDLSWGSDLTGFRIEECDVAMRVGYVEGREFFSGGGARGGTIEACRVGLMSKATNGATFSDFQILPYQTNTDNLGEYSMIIEGGANTRYENFRLLGDPQFADICTRFGDENADTVEISGIGTGGDRGTKVAWEVQGRPPRISRCKEHPDYNPRDIRRTGTVAVVAGVTSVDVDFPPVPTESHVIVNSFTEIAGSLTPGDYEWALVADNDQWHYGDMERWQQAGTVVSGGARLTFASPATGITRRLYRRAAGDEYWGYYDLADEAASFDDTGLAFDGYGKLSIPGAVLPEHVGGSDYRVQLTPEFDARAFVVPGSRTDTGFSIGLSSGHTGGEVNWALIRVV